MFICDAPVIAAAPAKRVPVNLAVNKNATASSEQSGNDVARALDGNKGTRWCANGGSVPQWLQVDLGTAQHLTGCRLDWENPSGKYRYTVEGSADGKTWRVLVDHAQELPEPNFNHEFQASDVRYVRVNCIGTQPGNWVSLWEINVFGAQTEEVTPETVASDKEKALLKEYSVPEGYDVTLFAAPPAVGYPVYVAAAPDGVVYVSVDKNGSIDRQPNRGSVYRLRDLDGDGRADETKLFVPNVDSPRGLVWDRDRLYLMHPPHLSAFIDKDGDGQADEEQVLVKNIAFGFKDRPADHTSNGVTLGIDGWLYLAIGDFGFMEAEGTDGRKVQFRGGGVVRVRPDGTGLEIYSRGTRNILEVALDPLLNGFTRDNTNDGGGWDIRLHQFTGLEDHGYPRLFKNFGDEIIQPLADYGGGSGCGALFLDEPGFPAGASPAVYTADWGRNFVFRHRLEPNGATFKPDQTEFLRLTRVTDIDVDANSHLYATSWVGATFTYAGEDVGFLLRLTPKGAKPEPLPNFEKLSEPLLVQVLECPSHRRRLAAQRELLHRGLSQPTVDALKTLAANDRLPLSSRAAALYALKQGLGSASHAMLADLSRDAALQPLAIRALADRWDQEDRVPVEPLLAGLRSAGPRARLESAVALARLERPEHAAAILPLLTDEDPVIAHTAVQALMRLKAADVCFGIVDRADAAPAARTGALRVLQGLHEPAVVDELIARLEKETNSERRHGLLIALCRLFNREGTWAGTSWGTRPDTRGPYYQPEPWSCSEKIGVALRQALDRAAADEASFLLGQLNRHRVRLDGTVDRLLAMAEKDPTLHAAAVNELTLSDHVPSAALPLLKGLARAADTPAELRSQSMIALLKSEDPDAFQAVLAAVPPLSGKLAGSEASNKARTAFLNPGILARHAESLRDQAERMDGPASVWAEGGLLLLAAGKNTSPEIRAVANKSVDAGWTQNERRVQILQAALLANERSYEGKALAAAGDADAKVAEAARKILIAWKLEKRTRPAGPLIQSLKPEDVIAQVVKRPGDRARGEQLFVRLNCGKCHTTNPNEPLRGPFLPQVAKVYKPDQIAESVLLPSKSIAQGFVTNLFVLDDGKTITGFVTGEAADEITLRDAEGREIKIATKQIEERSKQAISIMPEGLVKDLTVEEFSALVAYVDSLGE